MKRYTAYLKYVIRHKWFVLQECRKLKVPIWIALWHDWDKFLPDEFIPYAKCFYKPDGSSQYVESYLTTAWNHHQKRNKHHWQYWLITWDNGRTDRLPMPDVYRREMLADWRGAGKALGFNNTKEWYIQNKEKMKLHPDTQKWIEEQLDVH